MKRYIITQRRHNFGSLFCIEKVIVENYRLGISSDDKDFTKNSVICMSSTKTSYRRLPKKNILWYIFIN